MGRGLTFDAGALIAIEARRARIKQILAAARTLGVPITVPTVVVAEWWRGQKGPVARILDGVIIEPLTEEIARAAGLALAKTRHANAIGAIVMASAARRGDIVYTSDLTDLAKIARYFPAVRVLST
jgi:predicted nucleic acid-binding protein